jgi:hypothetical protein
MTQLRHDAAYILTQSHERTARPSATSLSEFDEQVCRVLSSAHTVKSAAKTLANSTEDSLTQWEERVAESMRRLLQAERIQLSPDS